MLTDLFFKIKKIIIIKLYILLVLCNVLASAVIGIAYLYQLVAGIGKTHSFRVALPPLSRARPAWYTCLLLIMKVQLLLILDCLLSYWH